MKNGHFWTKKIGLSQCAKKVDVSIMYQAVFAYVSNYRHVYWETTCQLFVTRYFMHVNMLVAPNGWASGWPNDKRWQRTWKAFSCAQGMTYSEATQKNNTTMMRHSHTDTNLRFLSYKSAVCLLFVEIAAVYI